jgi:hypothetical protein
MADELTLKLGRRGARLLMRELARPILRSYGDERRYLEALYIKLKQFVETPPPKYVEYKVISVNGVPVEEHGNKEDRR